MFYDSSKITLRWYAFEQADVDGRIQLFRQTIDDNLMTPTLAGQMAARLHNALAKEQRQAQFAALMDALKERLPDVYRAAGPAVIQWEVMDALLAQQEEKVQQLAGVLVETAAADLHAFVNTLDMLVYHDQPDVATAILTAAHPKWAHTAAGEKRLVEALTNRTTDEIIFAHLRRGETAVTPALLNELKPYFAIDEEGLLRYLAVLTGQVPPQVSAAQLNPNESEWQPEALGVLLVAWIGVLYREQGVDWSKGALLRPLLPAYYAARRTGQLNPRQDIAALMQGKRPYLPQPPQTHPLCPDHITLGRYFNQLLHPARPKPYRGALLAQLFPKWLQYLHQQGAITQAEYTQGQQELTKTKLIINES
ncbi:MAG: hypothetical protein Kow0080_05380 [Candidatus Promineifilaceae bacterium]